MNEGPLSRSYYQRFDTRKEITVDDTRSCDAVYNHDPHGWRVNDTVYQCPGGPIQGEKLVAEPVQYNGNQTHTGEVRMTDEWCDAKMRAVALELAIAFGKNTGALTRDTIMEHFDEFFLAIVGEGRPSQSRTESGL